MEVPVQYFQSVIAVETAVTGVLLFQIRFFATNKDAPQDGPQEFEVDPRLRVLLLIVLTATIFGWLEAIREGWGRWSAVLVTVGLALSVLPILLRVLPRYTATRAHPAAPSALLDHRARPRRVRADPRGDRRPPVSRNLGRAGVLYVVSSGKDAEPLVSGVVRSDLIVCGPSVAPMWPRLSGARSSAKAPRSLKSLGATEHQQVPGVRVAAPPLQDRPPALLCHSHALGRR